jgi:dihydroorotate dehydrogenase (fumarate)
MELPTTYLGLRLNSPLVVGSGPFDMLDTAKACAAAGAGMLVMHSLFEEQFAAERAAQYWSMEHGAGPDEYEAMVEIDPSEAKAFGLSPQEYFERVAQLKKELPIPVMGSINGTTPGNWVLYAQSMEEAGADAIELNLYDPVMDTEVSGAEIEARMLQVVKLVRRAVQVPLAVKLSPFYSSVAHLARQFDNEGIDGIVLFNRFYQPDFDIRNEVKLLTKLNLSTSDELAPRLRWVAALYGRLRASLAVTGGVHTGEDVIKAVLAGGDVVQVVSALIRHGPGRLTTIRSEMEQWMSNHQITGLDGIRGAMSLQKVLNRENYDRVNYVGILRDAAGQIIGGSDKK